MVGVDGSQIVATAMAGYDEHRAWLNYVAVAPEFRQGGLGRQMVAQTERRLRAMGCPKINVHVRRSNGGVVEFCQKIGFTEDDVLSMGKRLAED